MGLFHETLHFLQRRTQQLDAFLQVSESRIGEQVGVFQLNLLSLFSALGFALAFHWVRCTQN